MRSEFLLEYEKRKNIIQRCFPVEQREIGKSIIISPKTREWSIDQVEALSYYVRRFDKSVNFIIIGTPIDVSYK